MTSLPPVNRLPYGRRPDDPSRPKLDLTAWAASADFSMVPPTADYLAGLGGGWKMLGNGPDPDVGPNFMGAGDCEAVRVANSRRELTGQYPVAPGGTTLDYVWDIYRTQNPDFDPHGDPNVNGPGSQADGGMSTDALCDYLHKTGTPDGVKLVAYGTINPTDVTAVERAIGIFGGVWVDIAVLDANQTEFGQGQPWTNVAGSQVDGFHAVLAGGYIPQRRFITWATEATFADDFWTGTASDGTKLVQSVYLPIWPEHATHLFIASETGQQLAAQYQALTGRPLVWPDPAPTPPTPPPAPTPTPTPPSPVPPGTGATFLVSDQVGARVAAAAIKKGMTGDAWLEAHLERYFRIKAAMTAIGISDDHADDLARLLS